MKNGDELLWADLNRMLPDLGDNFMNSLGFNENITPIEPTVTATNVIHMATFLGATVFNYTDGLITEFKNQDYVENENLFTFPYDWRYGASGKYPDGTTNADLLAQKIQDILAQTGASKVDVVAHSEGGLIVKKYVIDHPADHHIGKAVFVGVPNTGAPKTIKVLLQGDNFGIPWLAPDEMKKIAANMPVVYDLSPSQQYYNVKGSFVKVVDEGTIGDLTSQTQKDLNYQEFGNFLTTDHGLNLQALTQTENLHTADFDNFDLRTAGIDLYAIDGCKAGTIGNIIEDRYKNIFGQSFIEYKRPKFTPGDNTVPLESATNLPINDDNKFYLLTANHSKMLSQDGGRQEIVNLLTGANLAVDSKFITQDISKCNLNGKAISIFSPIDIFVIDQDGNHLGNAPDGSVVSEIPNASVEIFGDHKFLYLPTDDGQIYTITIRGTGTGTYTIDSQDIVGGQVTGTQVFSNLPVTPTLTGQINLGTQMTLTVKETPDSINGTILPSAVVGPDQSEDTASPVSTSILSGTLGQLGFYRSDVNVNISAQDQIITGQENQTSGILSLNYNLDNMGYKNVIGNAITVPISNPGSHDIAFFAIDNAGNKEQEKTLHFVIDKTAPEAVIQFDPVLMNLKFTGTDNISDAASLLVQDKDNVVAITDQAGNTTEITLKSKNRKIIMTAEVLSLKYNGVAVNISQNAMAYFWFLDKNKKLIMLSQYVKSKNNYNILAIFDGKNTKLLGKDSSGVIAKDFAGLKIIKITTNQGNFEWSY